MLQSKASVIPDLKSASLISPGKIVDNNCTTLLDKSCLVAVKQNKKYANEIYMMDFGISRYSKRKFLR